MRFGTGAGLGSQLRINFGFNASSRFQYRIGFVRICFISGYNQADFFQR
jgi:hypothetical protein